MITHAGLDASDVARTFRVLRKLEPESVKVLRKELRTELKPMAKAIAAEYPVNPPLSGFQQTYGRWGWGKVTGTVKLTPGKSRKGAGRNSVVSLSMNYNNATPWVIDMIGRRGINSLGARSSRYKKGYGQGLALYVQAQRLFPDWPSGGRVFYKPFNDKWRTAFNASETIINRWSEEISKELERGD